LQYDATALRSTKKHLQAFCIDVAFGLQPHGAMHLLESDRNGAINQKAAPHVAFGINLDVAGLKPNTKVLGEYSQCRVEARGECCGQQIAWIRVIVVATDSAVYAEEQRRAVIVGGNDGSVERVSSAPVNRRCAVVDPGVCRGTAVSVAQYALPLLNEACLRPGHVASNE